MTDRAVTVQPISRRALLDPYAILDTPAEEGFDDIVELAREMCAVPTALISFVDDDRQWFKARVGFDACQTDLESSVCRHGLDEPELLVIGDLTQDARTRDNPLVTGPSAIRFYAGAPLRVPSGDVLGMLCVIDTQARPEGLNPRQRSGLTRLARQAVANLELRRHLENRDTQLIARQIAEAALELSEARWRGLFENMSEGFLVGQVIRGADGAIASWRYVSVNEAGAELVGLTGDDVVGRDIREVIPGIEDEWVMEFADVVRTGEPVVFLREVGALDRWYEGRCFRTGGDQFAAIYRDVTDDVRRTRQQEALLRLGDGIREATSIGAMSQLASQIIGTTLHVTRAGFGRVDEHTEVINVAPDWTAPGVPSVAGRHRFEDFGTYYHALARGEQVVIEDARTSPLTAAAPEALLDIGIQALVNLPVKHRGRVVAILIAHDDKPRSWTDSEIAFLRDVTDRLEQGIARMEADEHRELLHTELAHRLKNQLAIVQAVASQTLRKAPDLKTANEALTLRLAALGRAADVLTASSWSSAELDALVHSAFAPFEGLQGRYSCGGPTITFSPQVALSVTLALHELVTNASKYGALSNETGAVELIWSIDPGPETDGDRFLFTWRETGGPTVAIPERRGFGSALIERSIRSTLGGEAEIAYEPDGLVFRIDAPLTNVLMESE